MWKLEFSKKAIKQLSKLDTQDQKITMAWLSKNIDGCSNPRSRGRALKANLSGLWRYRIGDYRVLCDIQDERLVVFAVEVAHRREVYK